MLQRKTCTVVFVGSVEGLHFQKDGLKNTLQCDRFLGHGGGIWGVFKKVSRFLFF